MANYVYNLIKLKDIGDFHDIVNKYINEKDNFDFRKIIPQPKDLYMGSIGKEEEKLYGDKTWLVFNNKNWGTKWNASETEINYDKMEIRFTTAWSPPDPIFEKLLSDNQSKDIHILWSEEQFDIYNGEYFKIVDEYFNFNHKSHSAEARYVASYVRGVINGKFDWFEDDRDITRVKFSDLELKIITSKYLKLKELQEIDIEDIIIKYPSLGDPLALARYSDTEQEFKKHILDYANNIELYI
jgi:hypothetical protein